MSADDTLILEFEVEDKSQTLILRNPQPVASPLEQELEDAILGSWVIEADGYFFAQEFTESGYLIVYSGENHQIEVEDFAVQRYEFTDLDMIELAGSWTWTFRVRIPTKDRLILQQYDDGPDDAYAFQRQASGDPLDAQDVQALHQALIGQWHDVSDDVGAEFFADGTFTNYLDRVGSYEWLDGHSLRLNLTNEARTVEAFTLRKGKYLLFLGEVSTLFSKEPIMRK